MDTFNRLHLTLDLRNIRIARFHLNTTEINLGGGGKVCSHGICISFKCNPRNVNITFSFITITTTKWALFHVYHNTYHVLKESQKS